MKKMWRKKLVLVGALGILLVTSLSGCSQAKGVEKEIYVLAAASLTDALTEVAKSYQEMRPDINMIFSFDSSGTLKTQIEEGAPADVFVSAAMKQMNALEERGFIASESIIRLLENKVVLIKPTGSQLPLVAFEDVVKDEVEMIAIGNSDVPVGQYTEMIYTHLELWDKVQAKANLGTNVRQVLDWVATGNVDCGVVYATDAAIEKGVEVVCEAPKNWIDRVIYPVGRVASSSYTQEADAFITFLQSESAKTIFEKYGFTMYVE